MDFLLPRTFSDFFVIWPVLFLVFVPGFYLLGRLIWAFGFGPLAKVFFARMERLQQTVMLRTGQRLIGTADQLSKLQGWPFHNRNGR
ncbi:hypothetical protein [Serratia marcescens]|uniref:hypothetical protein n=1 Tax=Serratia marcescens TaxID=615 RepID=UPI0009A4D44D|nr:hypothetical protein [Serratia marcescens]OPJ92721.1 hypothetical protein B1R44_21700 [Serratia marcescens]